jgi:hypothetical protein
MLNSDKTKIGETKKMINNKGKKFYVDDKTSIYLPALISEFKDIPGMIDDDDGIFLYLLASVLNLRGDIIEIGSWQGKSTSFLARSCKDFSNGIVHSIDPFTGNPGKAKKYKIMLDDLSDLQENFIKNMKSHGLENYIKLYNMTSEKAFPQMKNVRARLIFIDGNHDYEYVKFDIKSFSKFLLKHGIIVLDDYKNTFPGVVQAVNEEIIKSNKFSSFIQTSNGLFIAKKIK